MYPTRLVDTNGNEIKLRYQGGLYYGGVNGSARVTEVEDVRAAVVSGGGYRSYQFLYNTDAIPHLTGIASDIGDGFSRGFSYTSGHSLNDPFTGAAFGTAARLNTMTLPAGAGQFAMEYIPGSHELKKVTNPFGGTLEWVHGAKTLAGTRTQMEVTSRIMNAADGQGAKTYTIYHDDNADLTKLAHGYTVVVDASLAADKAYFFYTGADYRLGLFSALYERAFAPGLVNMRSSTATWSATVNGSPYIAGMEDVIGLNNPAGPKASKVQQTIDDNGNLTVRSEYGFYPPGGAPPAPRIFDFTYMSNASYAARHIFNRLLTVSWRKPGGGSLTLASNTYDVYPNGLVPAVASPGALRQHDTAGYGTQMPYRGNLTAALAPGRSVSMTYDYTGTVVTTTDPYGHSVTQTPDSSRNYAVPSIITAGTLSTSFGWTGYNAPASTTAPNAATASIVYDAYGRTDTRTEPNGSVTRFTYSTSAPHWTLATTGTRWTKISVDGFGRAVKTEAGYNTGSTPTTVSIVDSTYAPCACSPIGKLWKISLPYAPGGPIYWTEYVYDALGRTLQVKSPTNSGNTVYSYAANVVTVTDPAGKWKTYENDAFGNLAKVTEPRPGGGTPYETLYTYTQLGQVLTVVMPRPGMGTTNGTTVTQTRTWAYDGNTLQLMSTANPENGTTSFLYNADGSLYRKTDANGGRVEYTYNAEGRVTAARRYAGTVEDTCARVDYYYGSQSFDVAFTQNAAGRVAATATGCLSVRAGQLIEMYSYTAAGAVTRKRLRMARSTGTVDKDVTYGYGTDGKLATVLYPGASIPYAYTYDPMDRPVKMTGPSLLAGNVMIDHAKDVTYGTGGQMTSMKYLQWQDGGNGTPYYFTESKGSSLFRVGEVSARDCQR